MELMSTFAGVSVVEWKTAERTQYKSQPVVFR